MLSVTKHHQGLEFLVSLLVFILEGGENGPTLEDLMNLTAPSASAMGVVLGEKDEGKWRRTR